MENWNNKCEKSKVDGHHDHRDEAVVRLSKRVCYILRYGAVKEGLHVDGAGFVSIADLMTVPLLKSYSEAEIIEELQTSFSSRKSKRFEIKRENGQTLVRAVFARRFEKNPYHENSKVHTLFEICIQTVTSNLKDYDLQNFPDEFIISTMIRRLKLQKKLNRTNLFTLLVPTLEHVDLEGMYLTEAILKRVWTQCPHLRTLGLKDCGYLMTDNLMERLLKKLQCLESLNLSHCQHLTDRTLQALMKHCSKLKNLNICGIKAMSDTAVLEFVQACPSLQHLDMYDMRMSPGNKEKLVSLARERGIKIVLRGLDDQDVCPDKPSMMMPNFGNIWLSEKM